MKVWILYLYLSSFGSSATGGAVLIDNFTTYDKCHAAELRFTEFLGTKLDDSKCIEIEK